MSSKNTILEESVRNALTTKDFLSTALRGLDITTPGVLQVILTREVRVKEVAAVVAENRKRQSSLMLETQRLHAPMGALGFYLV
jgi:hypothetical protein